MAGRSRAVGGWLVLGTLTVAFALLVLFVALADAVAPAVTVENASNVSYTSAHAEGTVDPQGVETSCHFEFISQAQVDENATNGLSEWEGAGQAGCNVEPLTGSGAQAVEAQLEGLNPSTVYHLRLVASNADGQSEAVATSTFETEAVDPASATIDPVTDVTGTTAHFSGSINPQAPAGNPAAFDVNWHFECSPECPGLAGGTISADSSDHTVEADASGLEPNTAYEVKLVASNAGGPAESATVPFTTEAIGPSAETVPAFALEGGTSALLGARIDPQNSATTYRIDYGLTAAYGETVTGDAGSGSERQVFSQEVGGLSPSTTYHFRAVAENATGETAGRDMTFETAPAGPAIQQDCPNAQLREENRSSELPDCRAYEMVSPPTKNGNDVGIGPDAPSATFVAYEAAENGDAFAFETAGALPGSQSATLVNQNLSERTNAGWNTEPISPAVPPASEATPPIFTYFSPDLDKALLATPPGVMLAPGAVAGGTNFYLRDNATGAYRTVGLGNGSLGSEAYFRYAGVSADMTHIVFDSNDSLTPDAPPTSQAAANTYEWVNGELRLVTILPNGEPTPNGGAIGGTKTLPIFNLVSDDGSRIVFMTAEGSPDGGRQLYLREDGERTVQVSASQRDVPDPTGTQATFWGASSDGAHIYFTSSRALTNDAQPGDIALYRFNVDDETLEDMTVSPDPEEEAVVLGVPGMSEDGSFVYFVSLSELIPGEGASGESNLYLWHDGEVRFIAPTSVGPLEDLHGTAYVTANGRYLAFQSSSRLTAYDNTDAVTGEPDTEVYRYDGVTDQLVCVSCNASGDAPIGEARLNEAPVYQFHNDQRVVSEDGDVYFATADALVPSDVNALQDVYAYQAGVATPLSTGTSDDVSKFAGASSDGDNVFIVTRQQLIPADKDENLDAYDVRVGGGFPQAGSSAAGCEGDECQGRSASVPAAATPGSSVLSPQGKAVRKRKRAKALRACRTKHHGKRQRKRCEHKVKQRFSGNADSTGAK
jgi:hypothetical protein